MVILFHYKPGSTILHKLDMRIKLALCVLFGFLILNGNILTLCLISALIVTAFIILTIPLSFFLRELKGFFIFLFFILIICSLTTPGEIILGLKLNSFYFGFTLKGIINGVLFSWRFLLIILFGCFLTITSSFDDIRASVLWLVKPFPFVNAKIVSTMVGLVLRFVPEILDMTGEISIAHRARCVNSRRNPFIRIFSFCRNLMYRTFLRADEITFAMQARCFSFETSDAESEELNKIQLESWLFLILAIIIFAVLIIIDT